MKQLSTLLIAAILFTAITPTLKAQVNTQDSLALVDLYDSTGGPNWRNHTNWLTSAPVSSWYGITEYNWRVTGISLDSNNLKGVIPASLDSLPFLSVLKLSNNQLNGTIPSLNNLTKLTNGYIASNQFTFAGMEAIAKNKAYANKYAPQATVPLQQSGDTLSVSVGGTPAKDTYNWYNRGTLVATNTGDSTYMPTGNGLYYVVVTNEVAKQLTLNSDTINIYYQTNTQDSLALVAFYNSTGGANWINHTNWLTSAPVSSWYGVIESSGRVTGIVLSSNNLTGSIPSSIDTLTYLSELFLDKNKLSGTTSAIVSLPSLALIEIENNQFTFAGMEGIENIQPDNPDGSSYYAPQATIPLYNNNNILSVSVGGTPSNNTFKWYKDGNLVATKVGDSTYTKTSNGAYWAVATNAVATQLTLYSDTITIADLPIKSINLQAKETNGQVLLQWQTIDEINTASFTIQHSTDGKTLSDIGYKEAVGSGNNGYRFIDKSPAEGINYYRIKAVDKTGAITYSKVASLTIDDSRLTIYPNPVKDVANIMGNHISNVQVIDNRGKLVKVIPLNDATNPTLSVTNLVAGVYFLHIKTTDGEENVTKLIKE